MFFLMLDIVMIIFTVIDENEHTIVIKFGQEAFDFAVDINNI